MTTSTSSLTFDFTSNANFRSWGSSISSSLVTCGLVLTSDTGQINWTTVTIPGTSASTTSFGYEIYRFSDTLQSTKPVFIKLEYGASSYSTSGGSNYWAWPVLWVTVGTGTNGAGTLTGTVSTRTAFGGTQVTSSGTNGSQTTFATSTSCYFSGDTSSINMALGAVASIPTYTVTSGTAQPMPFPMFLVVERTRSSAGVANGDGVVILTTGWPLLTNAASQTNGVLGAACQYLSFGGSGAGAVDTFWPISYPGTGFSIGSSGANLYLWPLPVVSPAAEGQSLAVVGCYKTDVALATTLSATVSGSSHTYISLAGINGTGSTHRSNVGTVVPAGAVLMRYE